MLIASKLNVSIRHKDQPRSINKGKKISLTIGELEVSYKLILLIYVFLSVIKLGLGTSEQVQIGSDLYKRSVSLHHEGVKDKVVFIR